jgi:hypothetical protein
MTSRTAGLTFIAFCPASQACFLNSLSFQIM